jgi:MoxR-like ATPase
MEFQASFSLLLIFLLAQINKLIVGQERLIKRLVIGLLASDHILIEGVPVI